MTYPAAVLASALADRYCIERERGAGGAAVYRASDLRYDRSVMLKVLHAELGAVIGGDRFLQDIRTTARLQPSHRVGLIDSGEPDGLFYHVTPGDLRCGGTGTAPARGLPLGPGRPRPSPSRECGRSAIALHDRRP